jgi:hypothetical protein
MYIKGTPLGNEIFASDLGVGSRCSSYCFAAQSRSIMWWDCLMTPLVVESLFNNTESRVFTLFFYFKYLRELEAKFENPII